MALLSPPEAPLDSDRPLLAARKRLQMAAMGKQPPSKPPQIPKIPKPQGRQRKVLSPDLIVGMTAAGVPQTRMAQALGVSQQVIKHTLSLDPDSRDRIALLREKLKDLKMQRAHQIEGKLWDRLETEVDGGDAKSVDAIARSLLASEKIQAAASGEAHASGATAPSVTNLDLKALINVLIDAST